MKTGISIPDDIFSLAEKIAQRMNMSRSELYSKAIKEFLSNLNSENITQQLDAIYGDDEIDSKIGEAISRAQSNILEKEEW